MSTSPFALSIVKPLQVTDAILQDTDVAEDDYAEWNSGTTYADGDRVILTSTHKIYESLVGSNTNNPPATSPTQWIQVSATNRWKIFDNINSSQTVQTDSPTNYFYYELAFGQPINAFSALNISNGTKVTITMTSPSVGSPGIVYQEEVSLTPYPQTSDWWAWFFGQKITPTQVVKTDLPAYADATIKVEFEGGDNLAVGSALFGQQQRFGLGLQYGARVGIQDYSIKQTNEFGDVVLLQRAFAKRANFTLFLNKGETDTLQNFLSSVRAVPCLWIGSEDYESTVLYGFYKNFDVLISYPEHSECDLEIEGLT